MFESFIHPMAPIPESFSRELDFRVRAEERPYGYTEMPPAAGTDNFNMHARESKVEYPRHKR